MDITLLQSSFMVDLTRRSEQRRRREALVRRVRRREDAGASGVRGKK
jgi:hypothetical protein